jgi:RNA polymerase subunit RPABC4/transcription elongation factor Spt4
MKRFCHRCRTRLRPSQMRCPYCRSSVVSWLHRAVIFVLALPAVFYLLKSL